MGILLTKKQKNIQKHFDLLLHCHKIPFWIFDKEEHKIRNKDLGNNYCCFNHLIGLPVRNDNKTKDNPLFDYQLLVYDLLQNHKHIWIKKATGLGITEFFLRYIAWLCLKDNTYQNTQICIVTGPNIDIAIKLIIRMKNLFERRLGIIFPNKETVLELNKCRIEAYPSNHLDAYRALDNPKFILLDEADFFRKGELENVRHVSERYIAKSDPYIVMVSTPNMPGGLFEQIENESDDKCLYKRIKLDYRYGLNKIYTEKEIEKAKLSPSFDREYDLKYLGKIGNVFSILDIENSIVLGEKYNMKPVNPYTLHFGGIDPGFHSSKTTVYVGELDTENEIVRIILGREYVTKTPSFIADEVHKIYTEIPHLWWFVDGSNRAFINELKSRFGEALEWEKPQNVSPDDNRIIPVTFQTEHKQMLYHTFTLMSKQKIAIPKKYEKLILSLKNAQATDFNLDKDESIENDHLDALRLLLKGVKFESVDDE